jgi:hypothetical protein
VRHRILQQNQCVAVVVVAAACSRCGTWGPQPTVRYLEDAQPYAESKPAMRVAREALQTVPRV